MPTERLPLGLEWRRLAVDCLLEGIIALPWLLLFYLGGVIASYRWRGLFLGLSFVVSATAALRGWHLTRRAAARYDDARLGDLLARVPDAPEWAMSPHPAQLLKRQHQARCLRLWGVTVRTSGWQRFRRSWRLDAAQAIVCLAGVSHALWLGIGASARWP